jgi:hypothetical protein
MCVENQYVFIVMYVCGGVRKVPAVNLCQSGQEGPSVANGTPAARLSAIRQRATAPTDSLSFYPYFFPSLCKSIGGWAECA